jgi:hypothetical protein
MIVAIVAEGRHHGVTFVLSRLLPGGREVKLFLHLIT